MTTVEIIGLSISIIGLLISTISLFIGRKKRKLVFDSNSTVLISDDLSKLADLNIKYNDTEIDSLVSTTVRIANEGNCIIEPGDIAPSSPVTIETTGSFLFQDASKYKVCCSNSKSSVSLEKISNKKIKLNFDYISPKDEIFVTVLHTGDVFMNGHLKQGKINNLTKKNESKDEQEVSYRSNDYYSASTAHFRALAATVSVISLGAVVFLLFQKYSNNAISLTPDNIFILLFAAVTIISIMTSFRRK